MKSSVFVTGSSGYVGRSLVKTLLQRGTPIHGLVPENEICPFEHQTGFTLYRGDLSNRDIINEAMEGCDFAFHLAAFARPWAPDSDIYYKVNVQGTRNILDCAKASGLKKVVITSSCSIISPSFGDPVNERTIRTVPLFNHYDFSKFEMEGIVGEYVEKGANVVMVSPPRIYGPGFMSPSNAVTQLISKYLQGKWKLIPGKGSEIGSYAYIDDVIAGHILAMEHGKPGEKYILGGDNRSMNDLFSITRKISGINKKLYRIPIPLVLTFSWLETKFSNLFRRKPSMPFDWARKFAFHWALSSDKAIKELGYKITPLEEGLKLTIAWIFSRGKNKLPESPTGTKV